MSQNPYTITFGKEPVQFIPRAMQSSAVVDAFFADNPSQQVFMVTGPRGSGKTVFMTEILKDMRSDENWVVVELNPERDLLESLASKLSSENSLANLFRRAKVNLSFFGFGGELKDTAPITDIEVAIARMVETLKKHGKRLLIAIDEASNSKSMRIFANSFQMLLRQDLPVFLLMTGLYANIDELQNQKTLTFLYRAPKIELAPLNMGTMARNYRNTLGVEESQALEMARLTRGYSFAFQVLGYLVWEHGGMSDAVIDSYRRYLDDFVYDKIWSELSRKDRQIAWAIAESGDGKVAHVREVLGISTNEFNPYRKRLIRAGLVNGDERGYVRFTLPCFEDYALENFIPEL